MQTMWAAVTGAGDQEEAVPSAGFTGAGTTKPQVAVITATGQAVALVAASSKCPNPWLVLWLAQPVLTITKKLELSASMQLPNVLHVCCSDVHTCECVCKTCVQACLYSTLLLTCMLLNPP